MLIFGKNSKGERVVLTEGINPSEYYDHSVGRYRLKDFYDDCKVVGNLHLIKILYGIRCLKR